MPPCATRVGGTEKMEAPAVGEPGIQPGPEDVDQRADDAKAARLLHEAGVGGGGLRGHVHVAGEHHSVEERATADPNRSVDRNVDLRGRHLRLQGKGPEDPSSTKELFCEFAYIAPHRDNRKRRAKSATVAQRGVSKIVATRCFKRRRSNGQCSG